MDVMACNTRAGRAAAESPFFIAVDMAFSWAEFAVFIKREKGVDSGFKYFLIDLKIRWFYNGNIFEGMWHL